MGTIESTECSHEDCENTVLGFAAAAEVDANGRWYCQEHRR